MKKIGILGGTFNPLHFGHLMMANEALHALQLDEVRFMPNSVPPHKKATTISDEARLIMLDLALAPYELFTIERFEIERGGISYTVETMEQLVQREPQTQFYFIIGGDMIASLHTWHRIDDLLNLVTFVGISRPKVEAHTTYDVIMLDAPAFDISSTMLRQRFAQQKTVQFLVPDEIATYVRKEGLYGAESITKRD